jgi:hypothetical protein
MLMRPFLFGFAIAEIANSMWPAHPTAEKQLHKEQLLNGAFPTILLGHSATTASSRRKLPTTKMSSTAHPPLSPTAFEFRNPKIVAATNGLFSLSWPIAAIFAP